MLYPVAITQQNKVFHAYLPDIPELEIQEKSMADTIATARKSVIDYLSKLVDEEQSIPEPSQINTHLTDSKYAGWTWAIINLDINRIMGEQIELNVNIHQRLYKRLQAHVEAESLDLNDFLINAIKKSLL